MISYSPLILEHIQNLVGPTSEADLQHVDCYVARDMGIFIPSTGHCAYAIQPEHTHPAYSFILFPSREQCFDYLSDQFIPGHYLVEVMSPDIPHQEEVAGGFKRYFALLIGRDFYESLYANYLTGKPRSYHGETFLVDPEIMGSIKSFMAEFEAGYPGNEETLAAYALIITHKLIRNQHKLLEHDMRVVEEFSIESVITYMHQHYEESLDISALARMANLSPSHFYRVFKREIGQTPMDYLNRIRLEKARRILRSGNSVTETALQCGFNSTSHFSTCFSRHFGISPSKYRSNYIPITIK